ncbi:MULTISPECIES: acyl carrier protein [Rhodonellum]|nr:MULTISPECIES: acyl carrier protein [Rhodonellum]
MKMNNYTQLRKIIQVFHQYGIHLFGKRKFDNLYHDLKMEPIFVMGLIFELELASTMQLNDEDAYSAQVPAQIIQKLIGGKERH